MKRTERVAIDWYPHELHFIKQHFDEMTWNDLLAGINDMRSDDDHILLGSLRHQCRRMGLKKFIIIHWCKADENFLRKYYHSMGNIEIAELLNQKRRSSRNIDGKKVFREFNKQSIEKKIKLLGLKRSSEDLKNIIRRNREQGRGFRFTKEENAWTLGLRQAAKDEDIHIWPDNTGRKRRYIKIDGHFIPYAPWFYRNFIGPVPDGFQVHHLDSDTLNDDPDNLACVPRMGLHSTKRLSMVITLLDQREREIMTLLPTIPYSANRDQLKQLHSNLNRIRKIRNGISTKLQKRMEKNALSEVRNQLK